MVGWWPRAQGLPRTATEREGGQDDVRDRERGGERKREGSDRTTERWIERQGEKDIANKRGKKRDIYIVDMPLETSRVIAVHRELRALLS